MKKILTIMILAASINTYSQWVIQPSGVTTTLRCVTFFNSNIGVVCGDGGKILKTTNGGLLWLAQSSGVTSDLNSIVFSNDSNSVFACGANGKILKTSNGGTNWIILNSGTTAALRSITLSFSAFFLIFAVGDNGTIIRSSNSGNNWVTDNSGTTSQLNAAVTFSDGATGYVAMALGNNGKILKHSTNNGWQIDPGFPNTENVDGGTSGIVFSDASVCTESGKIYKGFFNNWTQVNSGVTTPLHSMATAYSNPNTFTWKYYWAVGDNGVIRASNDLGNTWSGQNSFTTSNLYSIFMIDSSRGWVVGSGGTIINTVNGGGPIGIQQISSEIPKYFSLSQNYPNPFNPSTNIHFAIPKSSFVKLVLYDMLGREMEIIVDEKLNAGTYNAEWNAANYSSGIYFYKLETEGFSETKKMILVK